MKPATPFSNAWRKPVRKSLCGKDLQEFFGRSSVAGRTRCVRLHTQITQLTTGALIFRRESGIEASFAGCPRRARIQPDETPFAPAYTAPPRSAHSHR